MKALSVGLPGAAELELHAMTIRPGVEHLREQTQNLSAYSGKDLQGVIGSSGQWQRGTSISAESLESQPQYIVFFH
jgi:hypothetical protein